MNNFARFALIALAISVSGISAVAQEKKVSAKDVPPAVITAFKNAYPKATIRGYSEEKKEDKLYYEIESLDGAVRRDVLYNPDGTVAEVEESVDPSTLPAAAQQTIRQKYPRAVILLAEKNTVGDKITYEVSVRNGKQRITMQFDATGKELPKTKT